jgi:drug/metabolite transporter (DMT)-like permease
VSNVQLFVACVAIWGSTWLAITFQLGAVPPEASVAWRFFLASAIVFGYCLVRRLPLRYRASEHRWIALQGLLMFSASYIAVYYAEENMVSGLVAVGYSASPLLGMLAMRVLFHAPMTSGVVVGSILGIAGIVLVFWPEFAHLRGDHRTAVGATFTIAAVVLSTLGSVAAHRNQEARIPLWQGMAWAMLYGGACSLAFALATGRQVAFGSGAAYALSLGYLAIFGSVVAFAGYLTLIRRIGVARAGYIGVMVPIVALAVSAAFEGFRWHALTGVGIAVSVAGNVVVLRERSRT